ncbi:MAG: hypothetical protein CSB13_01395 [Chloroflexi bacterium]|nr:MAG: hypothetical protein CSB13_01395 [Chloroflexota bacterium]
MRSAFSFSSLVSASWRSGAAAVPVARRSRRSFSGWVAVVQFSSPVAAGRFARRCGAAVGVPCVVRGLAVSVPVSAPCGVCWAR